MATIALTQFYLLCYIIYTLLTSIIFSLTLAARCLLRLIFGPCNCDKARNVVALYEGIVYHARRHPARNSFRFHARYMLTNLDHPPYSPHGFLTADKARQAAKTNGPVLLLRIPPSMGYERSPVNLYYCYDGESSSQTLKRCLVEASNTPWGESVTFVFNASSDVVQKTEYISPFMDMNGRWRLKVNEPGEHLYVLISVHHPKLGNIFSASLTAERVSSSEHRFHDTFFWLLPHQVSLTTYWNATKLWWKNVEWYDHPRRQKQMRYREEAMASDHEMQRCRVEKIDRCFMWKEASWPWSS